MCEHFCSTGSLNTIYDIQILLGPLVCPFLARRQPLFRAVVTKALNFKTLVIENIPEIETQV